VRSAVVASTDEFGELLSERVLGPEYPCLGARSVFKRERATVVLHDDLEAPQTARALLEQLREYAATVDPEAGFVSFVAGFRGPEVRDEKHFEEMLWALLQRLHDVDEQPWAPEVSADPNDPHFAFSVAGTPFFIVGLHPKASREARRMPLPVLVFNLHEQFESLREEGGFERMRDTIRRRDEELQGSINPMVSDHGETSEARQYSGRKLEKAWEAPFEPAPEAEAEAEADTEVEAVADTEGAPA
jgi:FPC/CPF motif-containing protein YcgG